MLNDTLHESVWEDILIHLVPHWNEKAIGLKQLNWPEFQAFEKAFEKEGIYLFYSKAPSSTQKSVKLEKDKIAEFK